jgi:hypothetical protein
MDGISPYEVMQSLSIEANRDQVFSAGQGAGKSGSFFFFSHDHRFLIKTLKGSEKDIFLGMLDDYISHIKKSENMSLLARIYGVFTVNSNYFDPLDIIIMQNTASTTHEKMVFDLKGSVHNRKVKFDRKFWKSQFN